MMWGRTPQTRSGRLTHGFRSEQRSGSVRYGIREGTASTPPTRFCAPAPHVCRLLAGLVEDPPERLARPNHGVHRRRRNPGLAHPVAPVSEEPRRLVFVRSHGIRPGDLLDLLGHLAVLHNGDHANRHAPAHRQAGSGTGRMQALTRVVHRHEDVRDHADRPVSAPWSLAHLVTTLSSRSSSSSRSMSVCRAPSSCGILCCSMARTRR